MYAIRSYYGVGLGIAQALGLFQHDAEVQALLAHLGEDEIGGAVDDAGDPLDAVGRQPPRAAP